MAVTSQTRHILIKIDTQGDRALKQAADSLAGLNRSVKNLAGSFSFMNGAFGSFIGFLSVREIVGFADSMQNLNNRIAAITGSQEAANSTMRALLKTANDTNTSIDSMGESYARLSVSLKDTGISQGVLLDTVKVLQNTFRLSGSTITETTATIIQLGQAFASGQLRGQELRSVMEQNATLAILLRKEFGKDIFKKAADGAISAADVMRILFRNMDEINRKAEVLTPTIGQSLTKALNTMKFGLNEVNKYFDISGNFAKGLDYFVERLPVFGAAIMVLAVTQIPALITQLYALGTAFALSNPLTAILFGISVAVIALSGDMDSLRKSILKIDYWILIFAANLQELDASITKFQSKIPGFGFLKKNVKEFEDNAKRIRGIAQEIKDDVMGTGAGGVQFGPSKEEFLAQKDRMDYLARLEELYKRDGKADKIKDILARLNKEFIAGKINAEEYGRKLVDFNVMKLNREFAEGKVNLFQFNEGLAQLKREDLTREFNNGRISLEQFNAAIESSMLRDLNSDLNTGKISLAEYRIELGKIAQNFSANGAMNSGIQQYLNSVGSTTQQVAGLIQNTFTNLEGFFSDFIKNGKANFADFTKAILDDLMKIIVRSQIIAPLAQGLLSFVPTGGTTSGSVGGGGGMSPMPVQAKGGVWDQGVQKFASGGIVNTPTYFGHSKGTGLMGEAGPEAILPLSRGSSGNLGVEATVTPVTINIINNTNAEVQQQERMGPSGERMIEIIVANKMKDAFNSGGMDKTMQSAYGLRRKGG